ncbi:MAG: Aldehyde Dehydrogenase [Chloroflexi bacterium OLB15]|nr:MAG: Aldehyde Dehydrogenase [Chloroflexi bacterium OLB15]
MPQPNTYRVLNPYDDSVVGEVTESSREDVERAIAHAAGVRGAMADMTAYQRGAILDKASDLIGAQVEALALLMARESGKPLRYARGEVKRAVETFRFAADEARRLHGETVPLDAAQTGSGKIGYYVRVPVGVIAAITPFNFPLNLVAHKIAPAIAAGCPMVLKPNPQTPLTSLRLAEILAEAGLPDGAFQVVIGGAEVGEWLTTDSRVAMITFTGSVGVAHAISKNAGIRRTTFELGGNAAMIVDETADLATAVEKAAVGAFAYSGQVCISVQRIYVQRNQYEAFKQAFVERVSRLVVGDPLDEATELGPLINDAAADRIHSWLEEAKLSGAQVVAGGTRNGRTIQPTVLEGVDSRMKVMCAEIFGPVVNLIPFDSFEQALDAVNDSEFGLQAGVFTSDLKRALQAVKRLDVGGVMINESPMFRVDQMPYGGNKNSGVGREGPRYAVEDMTVLKMVVLQS